MVGAVAGSVWLFRPREKWLLEVARPVVTVDVKTQKSFTSKETNFWLTDTKLLILTGEEDPKKPGEYSHSHADLFDTTTHLRTRLSALTKLLNTLDVSGWQPNRSLDISPHGTWLEWQTEQDNVEGPTTVIAKWDGTQYRQIHTDNANLFWLDDDHLLEEERGDTGKLLRLTVLDAQNWRKDRNYVGSSPQAQAILAEYYKANPIYIRVGEYRNSPRTIEAYSVEAYASGPERLVSTHPFPQPPSTIVGAYCYDAGQQRMAYQLTVKVTSPVRTWLHKILPAIPIPAHFQEGIWISRPDGQGMHELGHVPEILDAYGNPEAQIYGPEWVPGGKQVSFIYKNMLYVVPILPPR